MKKISKECLEYIKEIWEWKYKDDKELIQFNFYLDRFKNLESFSANGNVFDYQFMNEPLLFMIRTIAGWYIKNAFEAMKIDMNDPNIASDLKEGNIGTPQRIAKILCGGSLNDDRELCSGRFSKKPRIAKFPNTNGSDIPITKKVDIISICSHHNLAFSTFNPGSYALISYIPNKFVIGISKLQRMANWVSQRMWLQEDLTKALWEEIVDVTETKSVYVVLKNIVHSCEKFRGAKSNNSSFSTEYYDGLFNSIELRNQVNN